MSGENSIKAPEISEKAAVRSARTARPVCLAVILQIPLKSARFGEKFAVKMAILGNTDLGLQLRVSGDLEVPRKIYSTWLAAHQPGPTATERSCNQGVTPMSGRPLC